MTENRYRTIQFILLIHSNYTEYHPNTGELPHEPEESFFTRGTSAIVLMSIILFSLTLYSLKYYFGLYDPVMYVTSMQSIEEMLSSKSALTFLTGKKGSIANEKYNEQDHMMEYKADFLRDTTRNTKNVQIVIISYNLAHYNNDTTTYISDEQLKTLKELLSKIDADFVITQEDSNYIDFGQNINANDYIYKEQYPFFNVNNMIKVHSKMEISNSGIVFFSTKRAISYCTVIFDEEHVVLLCSTHPSPNSVKNPIETRKKEYEELFSWINGKTVLQNIYVPEHTHCIIGADMNSTFEEDRFNLSDLSGDNGFSLCNGGSFGWIGTNLTGEPIDNIIVSNNIIINDFKVLNNENGLYSDHYPIVAELELQ